MTPERNIESELKLLSAALNAAIDGIVITDAAGFVVWVNQAALTLSGYAREELVGQPAEIQRSDAQLPTFHEAFWQQIRSGRPWTGEFINRRKDGSLYTESTTITPVLADDGTISHYIAVKRDVSEDKLRQQRVLQAQKMELVGRIAGNIAHDFNNLLGVINGTADLAAMSLPDDAEVKRDLETIRQAGDRAAVLTRQLLAFSRHHVVVPKVIDLHQTLHAFHQILVRIIPANVRIDLRTLAARPTVRIDPMQVEQIVLNLAINAKDAMPTGGTLTIATTDDGQSVILSVIDTGTGIAPDILPRIFEPFFTTKDSSTGTGLGLSTVLDMVTSSHGTIDVVSAPGQGSTFTITWPRVPAAVVLAPSESDHHHT